MSISGFLINIWTSFTSATWWGDNVLGYLIFGALVALLLDFLRIRNERRERQPYEGWRLVTIGFDDPEQNLYWEEVKRFHDSEFELWKFAKSVVSGPCLVSLRTAEPARKVGWLRIDKEAKRIIVDFTKMPDGRDGHVIKWNGAKPVPPS